MLNEYQQKAVDCNDNRIVCLAGAGTGKTHTLISRIIRLVESGVSPRSILVLTFTNAAGKEMKSRYGSQCSVGTQPEFRTFHSFCYHLICRDTAIRNLLGYHSVPSIVTPAGYKKIQSKVKQQLKITLSDNIINGQIAPRTENEKFQLDIYTKGMRRQLISDNLITFDMLCYDVCQLFCRNDTTTSKYKQQFKYIFVDEFQDTDRRQWEFVKSFTDANLFVVGDILQQIYSFRGSTDEIIKSLVDSSEWTCIRLPKNYRSTQQICDFATKHSKHVASQYRLDLISDTTGPAVTVLPCNLPNYPETIDEDVITEICKWLPNYVGTTAILCRTNREVQEMVSLLQEQDICVSTSTSSIDVAELLNCTLNDEYFIDYVSSSFDASKYAEYIRLSELEDSSSPNYLMWFLRTFGDDKTQKLYKQIINLRTILNNPMTKCFQKVAAIAQTLKLNIGLVDSDLPEDTDIVQFITDILNNQKSSIYVGTIHSVKGLEYTNVILVNVGTKLFSLDSKDNCNLYYVGITRAKTNLVVFHW